MATPNYAYEKRQRELAKKKKQEFVNFSLNWMIIFQSLILSQIR